MDASSGPKALYRAVDSAAATVPGTSARRNDSRTDVAMLALAMKSSLACERPVGNAGTRERAAYRLGVRADAVPAAGERGGLEAIAAEVATLRTVATRRAAGNCVGTGVGASATLWEARGNAEPTRRVRASCRGNA